MAWSVTTNTSVAKLPGPGVTVAHHGAGAGGGRGVVTARGGEGSAGGGWGPSDPRVMVIQLPRPPMWLQDFGAKLTDSLDKGDC